MEGPVVLNGEWRSAPGSPPVPCRVELGPETFAIVPSAGTRLEPQYRDVASLTLANYALTLAFDGGLAVELLRFGPTLSQLVATIRERRARQLLGDRLILVPADPLEGVDATAGAWGGRAYAVPHPWGFALVPYEPDGDWVTLRRAEIADVTEASAVGGVAIRTLDGTTVELRRLGAHSARHAAAARALAAGAAADAGALVGALLPDASFGVRTRLASLLVDGRPASRSSLGDAWDEARRAVVGTGEFGGFLDELLAHAGSGSGSGSGSGAEAWLALAPVRPGTPEPKAWFFVAHPSGLVALEVVTPGSHATYCFRPVSRDPAVAAAADAAALVALVSNALVDLRFLREPIALPEARLAAGGRRDYRRTVAALPSLRAARAHFVGRLVHDEGWGAALDDAIAWTMRGEDGDWPGRSGQDSRIAAVDEAEDEDAGGTGGE